MQRVACWNLSEVHRGWQPGSLCSWSGQVGRPRGGRLFKNTHCSLAQQAGRGRPSARPPEPGMARVPGSRHMTLSQESSLSSHNQPGQAPSSSLEMQGCRSVDRSHLRS